MRALSTRNDDPEKASDLIEANGMTAVPNVVTKAGGDDEVGRARRTALAEACLTQGSLPVAEAFRTLLFAPETMEADPGLVAEVYNWMMATDPQGAAAALIAMRERPWFQSIGSGRAGVAAGLTAWTKNEGMVLVLGIILVRGVLMIVRRAPSLQRLTLSGKPTDASAEVMPEMIVCIMICPCRCWRNPFKHR